MTKMFCENDYPYTCTPLTGKNTQELITELATIVPKNPDLLEWRVDFFNEIDQLDKVLDTLQEIHHYSNGIPLLFTIRSQSEGGQEIPLDEKERVELLCKVCESDYVDMIDFEVMNHPNHIKRIRETSKLHQTKLVLSFHHFECTPKKAEIFKLMVLMQFYGADVAKVAVMPNSRQDVISLLEVTQEANETLSIPVVTMSMGELGAISRILGWYYGSAITFAVGKDSSAPGQIPIETLRQIIGMVKDPGGYKE